MVQLLDRWVEHGLLDALEQEGMGCIAFSPRAQRLLTDRYLEGTPSGARASKTDRVWLTQRDVDASIAKVRRLHEVARRSGRSLAQMAIAWVLRTPRVTSALSCPPLGDDELREIEGILAG